MIGVSSCLGAILISAVFITAGLTCGYYHGWKRIKSKSGDQNPTTPVYEDINIRYIRQDSELIDNLAYDCVSHSTK